MTIRLAIFDLDDTLSFYAKYGFENRPSPSKGAGMSYIVPKQVAEAE